MGWLSQSAFSEARDAALALTQEERKSLTWEDALRFVVADTLDMARWAGLVKSCATPWAAVKRLRNLPDDA